VSHSPNSHAPLEGPLVIDSRRLHRQPGSSLRLAADAPIEAPLGNDVLAVPAGTTAEITLLLESVLDGILVTGRAVVRTRGTCVRCLDDIDRDEEIEFRQFFSYPGAEPTEADDESEDVVELVGNHLDLRPAFRDAVLLALPLTPTCRPDCPGLCPECGHRLADDPDHKHEHHDPRWSALAAWQPEHPSEGE
jgi:uncharacterized protein